MQDVVDHLIEAVDGGEGQGKGRGALGVLEMDVEWLSHDDTTAVNGYFDVVTAYVHFEGVGTALSFTKLIK